MAIITVAEGSTIPLSGRRDAEALRNGLMRLSDSLPFTAFKRKGREIQAGEGVGAIGYRGIQIEILPKTSARTTPSEDRNFLVNLLRYAGYLPRFHTSSSTTASTRMGFIEPVITEVAREILDGLRDGVPRRYQEQRMDSSAIRGRIDFNVLSKKLPSSAHRIPIRFSPLTENNKLACLIKWTALTLFDTTHSVKNKELLAATISLLSGVDERSFRQSDPFELATSRYESQWSRIIEIAKVLAQSNAPNPAQAGKTDAFLMLLPLKHIFERSLRILLRYALQDNSLDVRHNTDPHYLLTEIASGDEAIRLKPDFVFDFNGNPSAIGDAKWKRLVVSGTTNGITPTDLYQLSTYMAAYKVDKGLLLFPKTDWMHSQCSGTWMKRFRLSQNDKEVFVLGIDIAALVSDQKSIRKSAMDEMSSKLTEVHSRS